MLYTMLTRASLVIRVSLVLFALKGTYPNLVVGQVVPSQNSLTVENAPKVSQALIDEANSVHNSLILGVRDSFLLRYKQDTVWGTENSAFIEDALSNDKFMRHSTRIDTTVNFRKNDAFIEIHIAFRDIYYLGNDKFTRFRLNVAFYGEEHTDRYARRLTFHSSEVKSQSNWHRHRTWSE